MSNLFSDLPNTSNMVNIEKHVKKTTTSDKIDFKKNICIISYFTKNKENR
jgi:hypothetical protein